METTFRSLISIILLTLAVKESYGCSLNNITIGTTRSGREIKDMPEWNVVVINNCNCTQSSLVLSCVGFKTLEPVDPSIFLVRNNTCLLIKGNPLPAFGTVNFSYVWYPPFIMRPTSSVIGPCK
ncbi:TPD1 protein homolog 1B-like [Cicer arietinum]|uniref:Uncharacterized protein LOC101490467 n=1 Tax=Cicer arietinum TaxID=3827 RepID=A0A1S2Z3Y3_CICAR|nr:uncharacterized protein LOC101490467 [Cicer arietinum]